jgi:uncharacterized protein
MKPHASQLPNYAPAETAIQREAQFTGAILVERLPRLVASLASAAGTLDVRFQVGNEIARPPFLRGEIRGELQLTCQRCLEIFDWPLQAKVDLRLVRSEAEEARWLQDYEPYLIEDDRLHLHEMVEDEVLLALPLSPRCAACAPPSDEAVADAGRNR